AGASGVQIFVASNVEAACHEDTHGPRGRHFDRTVRVHVDVGRNVVAWAKGDAGGVSVNRQVPRDRRPEGERPRICGDGHHGQAGRGVLDSGPANRTAAPDDGFCGFGTGVVASVAPPVGPQARLIRVYGRPPVGEDLSGIGNDRVARAAHGMAGTGQLSGDAELPTLLPSSCAALTAMQGPRPNITASGVTIQ